MDGGSAAAYPSIVRICHHQELGTLGQHPGHAPPLDLIAVQPRLTRG
jgi:hypothetical protein